VAEELFRDVLPEQLREWLAQGRTPRLIDMRDESEWAAYHLPGAELISVSKIDQWCETLDPQEEVLLYCHHGIRSLLAAMTLSARGFSHVMHLRGGLDAYSLRADSRVPRY
jgi:rhodanese-related sulfurtransferase